MFFRKVLREFKEFAVKGNAFDLAVGIIIGSAFYQVVTSLVNDLLTPPLGWFTGQINLANLKIHLYGETFMTYGRFLATIINFFLVSVVIFLIVREINKFRSGEKNIPTQKECPFCTSNIPKLATRCPYCTSHLP
jgi:large conductance mechanosensitive channel